MKRKHIAFIGGRKDAFLSSLKKLGDPDRDELYIFYTPYSYEKVWKEIRETITNLYNVKEEIELKDYTDVNSLLKSISNLVFGKEEKLINITGLSKEGSLSLFLYFIINNIKNITIAMVQMPEGEEIIFSPEVIKAIACELNGRNNKLMFKILEELKRNGGSMSLKELEKRLNRKKPTLSDSIKSLEKKRLVFKEKRGRELVIKLNKYLYDLMDLLGGKK